MRLKRGTQHEMQGVFVFVLLGMFAVMSTLLVLLGAQMYRGTVDRSEADNASRIMFSYVRSMVRAEDAKSSVDIEDHEGVKALTMHEEINGEPYVTWLYSYEGNLYEQFTRADREFSPASGTVICPAGVFEPVLEGNLLTVTMEDEMGEDCSVTVALRCGEGL